jgi:hypothetical protein
MSILNERQKTHGEYANVARIAQAMKDLLATGPSYHKLTPEMRETLDLICTKNARIVCGNPFEEDHWIDGSGYYDLVVFNLKDKNTASRAEPNKETPDERKKQTPVDWRTAAIKSVYDTEWPRNTVWHWDR